jgi:hypothetical protein
MKGVIRRRKNNVLMLRGEDDQWVDNVEKIRGIATDFYQKLFSMNQIHLVWHQTNVTYLRLSNDTSKKLNNPTLRKR